MVWPRSTRNERASVRFRAAALFVCALLLLDAGAGEAGNGAKTSEGSGEVGLAGPLVSRTMAVAGNGLGRQLQATQGRNSLKKTASMAGDGGCRRGVPGEAVAGERLVPCGLAVARAMCVGGCPVQRTSQARRGKTMAIHGCSCCC